MNRREFLKSVALASSAPLWVRLGSLASFAAAGEFAIPNRLLLVLYLAGGNDGLNTVVPYLDSAYTKARPTIALAPGSVLDLGATGGSAAAGLGLHPSLTRLKAMWDAKQAAIVQNVGYPNPSFSHFDSTYIWETASPDMRFHTGWLGRYLDATDKPSNGPVRAVAVGFDALPRTLISEHGGGVALTNLSDFSFADGGRADTTLRRAAYQNFGVGRVEDGSMRTAVLDAQEGTVRAVAAVSGAKKPTGTLNPAQTVAAMFAAGVGTEVGFIFIGGFDTHTAQPGGQASSLTRVNKAIGDFFDAAKTLGIQDRVTILTFSDFGRRVGENASHGTDHGSSAPMFVLGQRVNGGIVGARPDLSDLSAGNLKPAIHMGSVYSSVIKDAFNVDPVPIVGGSYPTFPLLG